MAADLDDIFRQEAGRLVPYLLRRLGPRHFDLAEDAVQDAFVAALRHWPASGVPDDPRAWAGAVALLAGAVPLRLQSLAVRDWDTYFAEINEVLRAKLQLGMSVSKS